MITFQRAIWAIPLLMTVILSAGFWIVVATRVTESEHEQPTLARQLGEKHLTENTDSKPVDPALARFWREKHFTEMTAYELPPGAGMRLGSVAFVQSEPICELRVLPDGNTLVTVARKRSDRSEPITLRHYSATTGKLLTLTEVRPAEWPAQFSPDYCFLYMPSATSLRVTSLHGLIEAIGLSPDGRTLAVAMFGGRKLRSVKLCELETGKELRSLQLDDNSRDSPFTQLAYSEGGNVIGTFQGNTILFWDPATGKEIARIKAPDTSAPLHRGRWGPSALPSVHQIGISRSGDLVAYTHTDSYSSANMYLHEVATGKELRKWSGRFTAPVFSPDDRYLVAIDGTPNLFHTDTRQRGAVHVWDVATGEEVASFGKEWTPAALAFSADGRSLFTGGNDGCVRRWEFPSGRLAARGAGHSWGIHAVLFSPDQKSLVTLADGIGHWDLDSGKLFARYGEDRHIGDEDLLPRISPLPRWFPDQARVGLRQTAFSPDGKSLVTAGWDRTLRHWDIASAKEIGQTKLHTRYGPGFSDQLSPDGATFATYNGARQIHLLDPATGRERCSPIPITPQPLAFSPDGRVLATAEPLRNEIVLWEVVTGKRRGSLNVTTFPICDISFSCDGRLLLVHAQEKDSSRFMALWDLVGGEQIQRLEVERPTWACFSPDGKVLAIPDDIDNAVVLWDWQANHLLCRLKGHLQPVFCLTFSPDGKTLASGSADHTVLVWDLARVLKETVDSADLDKRWRVGPLSVAELNELWNQLGGEDASRAAQAIWRLEAGTGECVPFLREHLAPASPLTHGRLARLITDLEDDQFAVRERASNELDTLGALAEPALRELLAGDPSPEVKRRVESLLEKRATQTLSRAEVQCLRAIEVLERVGTVDAMLVVESLSKGAPEARQTQEASRVLRRMAARVRPRPN